MKFVLQVVICSKKSIPLDILTTYYHIVHLPFLRDLRGLTNIHITHIAKRWLSDSRSLNSSSARVSPPTHEIGEHCIKTWSNIDFGFLTH
jgi:hypothetical protein